MSISQQCSAISLPRSTYYFLPAPESEENLQLMKLMDEQYTEHPSSGTRTMVGILRGRGYEVGRDRIRSLMRKMGIVAVYPKPRTTIAAAAHKKYPYLLRNLAITSPNQVWCMDITYIRMEKGFVYLTAVMDWYSRYVLSWRLSNTMECTFCIESVEEALSGATPKIFNTDQGVQFTSSEFTTLLEQSDIRISMDGKGRWMDNVFIERLWRSVKYELVYMKEFKTTSELFQELDRYFRYYNHVRPHQGLDHRTPISAYTEE